MQQTNDLHLRPILKIKPPEARLTHSSGQNLSDYELVVSRPRWVEIILFLIAFSCAFSVYQVASYSYSDGNTTSPLLFFPLAIPAVLGCGLFLYGSIMPQNYRFLFAIGKNGILMRPKELSQILWLVPWASIDGMDSENPTGMDCINIYFSSGKLRFSRTFFMRYKKSVLPLIEKYRSFK